MSPARLPDPQPVEDAVMGTITAAGQLLIGLPPPADTAVIHNGPCLIRYAIPLIVPSTDALLPGLFLSERGQTLTGREAWNYLQSRFQMHPRADVIGWDVQGHRQQVLVKALDFGAVVRVLAYADQEKADNVPLVELSALLTDDATYSTLPELLKRYLPRG